MPPPSVEVVVPWQGSCSHRERAWDWCKRRYDWPTTFGFGATPWCKAQAVMPAIELSDAEVVVVADADVWTDGLAAAIAAVVDGAPFAVPHTMVNRLTEAGTAALIAGEPWQRQEVVEPPNVGRIGGGFVVARREDLLRVPMDPRFVGWGQEDTSWGVALRHLLGEPWRGSHDLVHLWHPPQERISRKYGSHDGRRLWLRYLEARKSPDEMEALIEEARCALQAAEPQSHADLAV